MDRLRASILEARSLEARQEVEDLLAETGSVPEVLADLYFCAAHRLDPRFSTPHALIFVHNLDRITPELESFGLLLPAFRHAVAFLVAAPAASAPVPALPATATPPSLATLVADGDVAGVASWLLGLEDPRREPACRTALLDLALDHLGHLGHTLIHLNAFLHGFERVGAADRAVLAGAAAGYLVRRVREDGVAVPPWDVTPPIPGNPSAGELLAALREFDVPRSLAALSALCSLSGYDEVLTVLLMRAEENAGPHWHNLILADAARDALSALPPERRQRLLVHLLQRLLVRAPGQAIVERLADGVPETAAPARERRRAEEHLAGALRRADPDVALAAARLLLATPEGADLVRRPLLEGALTLPDAAPPHAFIVTATCLAAARANSWPAQRAPLLRAVYALAAERDG